MSHRHSPIFRKLAIAIDDFNTALPLATGGNVLGSFTPDSRFMVITRHGSAVIDCHPSIPGDPDSGIELRIEFNRYGEDAIDAFIDRFDRYFETLGNTRWMPPAASRYAALAFAS